MKEFQRVLDLIPPFEPVTGDDLQCRKITHHLTHCILHMKDNALDMARKNKLPGYPGNLQKDIVCAATLTETGRFNKAMEKFI